MVKIVEENERIKRRYMAYLKGPKGRDEKTINKIAAALRKFEESTGYKPFKKFHIDQGGKFRTYLENTKTQRTKRALSHSTIDATLRMVKTFIIWLSEQPGYKSRISYIDAEYFNNNRKNARIAHTQRHKPYPSIAQCKRAFEAMPEANETQMRDKAAFAFIMLSGARIKAMSTIRLKHIDLEEGYVLQDARDVNTKNAKTIPAWFFPVDHVYFDYFRRWILYLREEKLFGPEDALLPKPNIGLSPKGGFANLGLSRDCYKNAAKFNDALKTAFQMVQMPAYTPHSLRKTLGLLLNEKCKTPEQMKAWSMNMGHEHMRTTMSAYMPVSHERQGELMKAMREEAQTNIST